MKDIYTNSIDYAENYAKSQTKNWDSLSDDEQDKIIDNYGFYKNKDTFDIFKEGEYYIATGILSNGDGFFVLGNQMDIESDIFKIVEIIKYSGKKYITVEYESGFKESIYPFGTSIYGFSYYVIVKKLKISTSDGRYPNIRSVRWHTFKKLSKKECPIKDMKSDNDKCSIDYGEQCTIMKKLSNKECNFKSDDWCILKHIGYPLCVR